MPRAMTPVYSIHPAYPIAAPLSVDRLMDIAVGMEHEAAERYRHLADGMERVGDEEMAALFHRLADMETAHEEGLERWARREGRPAPAPAQFSWQMPETFGDDDDDGEARVMTPYQALALAVRNEQAAFAFYTYLAAIAADEPTEDRALALAREELEHIAELRQWRRRAYHAQRRVYRHVPRDARSLRAVAYGLEAGSHELDGLAAAALGGAAYAEEARAMQGLALADAERVRQYADAAAEMPATDVVEQARAAGRLVQGALSPIDALRLALRNAEEVLDLYMAAADHSVQECVLNEAQRLSEAAVARLLRVRVLLAHVEAASAPR